jgi:serine/threonine protein kinase
MYMDRVRLSPDNLNECPQKWAEQQSSDVSFPNRLQELRKYHLRTTNLYLLETVRTNKTFTSELDRTSARQTEDVYKEVLALLNKGKCQLSTEEEKWLKSIPIGEDGKRVPRIDLSTKFTPNRLILVGGMNGLFHKGETSRRNDSAGENFNGPRYGNYRCGRYLGEGTFGEVYLAQHVTSREIVAVKVLKQEHSLRHFEREANILKSLNHPNIVRFVEYNKNNGYPYLVMEYARYGTLRQACPKSLKQAAEYVDQIANALDYLHNCPHEIEGGKGLALPLMHLDLKHENILLVEGPCGEITIKLADVGLAQEVCNPGSQPAYRAGTHAYMAPEHRAGYPCIDSDQYSLAVMVYEWLSGGLLPTSNPKRLSGVSQGINDVVLKALDNDPNKRYRGVKAFAKAFRDAYIKERDIQIDEHYKSGEKHIQNKRYDKAYDDLTRVIAMDGNHARAFAYRGAAYLGMKQLNEAMADLNQALKLSNGSNMYALLHRGVVYRKMGRYDEAWADITQVRASGHSWPWIEDELEKLRQLMRGNRR